MVGQDDGSRLREQSGGNAVQEWSTEAVAAERRRQSSAHEWRDASTESGIPEDDGMADLRRQLNEIRLLAITTEERAQCMHALMTKDYLSHISRREQSIPPTDIAPVLEQPPSTENPYKLRPGDLELTFSPITHQLAAEEDEPEQDVPVLGCMHYSRNVKIQCFDCERWFPCRHCHDAAHDLPFKHTLNRKKTKNMLCMLCRTPQPAAEVCHHCGEYAAWYYCSKCKLWDNDTNKKIYHCDDCGLCRLGEGLGKDFVHCKRCNVCISIATSAAHPCIERATDSDCPLCLSYLFESRTTVVSLPCGHYMHADCYKDLMAVTYKCPVCNKSAVNMELQWRKLDDEIEAQPMPEDDQELAGLLPHVEGVTPTGEDAPARPARPRGVWIGCNDCRGRCYTPFHWLGLKCQVCGGYNTNQMAPPAGRETEAERMLRLQAQHRQHDFTGNGVLRDVGIGIEDDDDRTDSAYAASSSPPAPPPLHRRASEAHSPGRRYFVQLEEPRRSSFTTPRMPNFSTPRFSAPSMPNLPNLPQLPRLPDLPSLQDMSLPSLPQMQMPNMPSLPQMQMPNMPSLPHMQMPNMPSLAHMQMPPMPSLPQMQMPGMPNIELPRFNASDMVAMLSRSLSPMRVSDDFRRSFSGWRNSVPPAVIVGEKSGQGVQNDVPESAVESDDEEDELIDDPFEEIIGHR